MSGETGATSVLRCILEGYSPDAAVDWPGVAVPQESMNVVVATVQRRG